MLGRGGGAGASGFPPSKRIIHPRTPLGAPEAWSSGLVPPATDGGKSVDIPERGGGP